MDLNELEKKTVTDLREMAEEYDDLEGVSGMKKEVLVEILCKKLGIQKKKAPPKGIGRKAMKGSIASLKTERDSALSSHDHKSLKLVRSRLKRTKHRLRQAVARAAHAEKVANQGKKAPEKTEEA
jgi:hypothetical protein